MTEGKRMTEEREAEIRAFVDRHPNGYYGELARELDATRADLAELVAALPRCETDGCEAPAMRWDDEFHIGLTCDDPHHDPPCFSGSDVPWAPLLRRLAAKGASGE